MGPAGGGRQALSTAYQVLGRGRNAPWQPPEGPLRPSSPSGRVNPLASPLKASCGLLGAPGPGRAPQAAAGLQTQGGALPPFALPGATPHPSQHQVLSTQYPTSLTPVTGASYRPQEAFRPSGKGITLPRAAEGLYGSLWASWRPSGSGQGHTGAGARLSRPVPGSITGGLAPGLPSCWPPSDTGGSSTHTALSIDPRPFFVLGTEFVETPTACPCVRRGCLQEPPEGP